MLGKRHSTIAVSAGSVPEVHGPQLSVSGGGGELLTPSTFSTATVYMWRLRHNLSLKSGP